MSPSKKILIIDDEIDLCLLLKDYFLRKDYEVIVAHTLQEGRDHLNKIHPDVLVLDNNLPDGTGWIHAPDFAVDFPNMYIVLVSAFHPSMPKMPTGAQFRTIEKPIRLADLDRQFSNL